jgi:shikimate dehydrogenase
LTFTKDINLYGVIGYPITHSVSPILHNAALKYHNKSDVYIRLFVKPGQLGLFIDTIPIMNLKAFNITMPYKSAIIPYLSGCDQEVRLFNAANAVRVSENGLYGYSFDGDGYVRSLEFEGIDIEGRDVVFLGAGDVTGIMAYSLGRKGASSFTFLNRTTDKAKEKAELVHSITGIKTSYGSFSQDALVSGCEKATLLIQSTPLGMPNKPGDEDLSFLKSLPTDAVVSDIVPSSFDTEFQSYARRHGYKALGGIGMLICQAQLFHERILGLKTDKAQYDYIESVIRGHLEGR